MTRELSSCPHTKVTVLLFHPLYRVKFSAWEMIIIGIIGWLTLEFSVSVTLLCRSTRKISPSSASGHQLDIIIFFTFTFKRLSHELLTSWVPSVWATGENKELKSLLSADTEVIFFSKTAEDSRIFFSLPQGRKNVANEAVTKQGSSNFTQMTCR